MENRLKIVKESKGYWRVVISNPPVNLFDPWMFAELNVLMDQMERDEDLRVVVFESADENFFMDHHDVEHRLQVPEQEGGRAFFFEWSNWVSRLANSRVISIAKVRGRAWAQGFEFILACDLVYASEKAQFALIEVGGGAIPGGGGIEWLSKLVGRSRAIEIVCSSESYNAELGEKYGFVTRAIPDSELDQFVDHMANRLAKFPKLAMMVGKRMVNARAGVPSTADLFMSQYVLRSSDLWEDVINGHKDHVEKGFNIVSDLELNLPSKLEEN